MTDQDSDPTPLVRRGYDLAGESYTKARSEEQDLEEVECFHELLASPAAVLDVGCGAGIPVDRCLVDLGYDVTGIDISPKQIELARRLGPDARFEVRNMLDLRPGEYGVDGVVSLCAVFHTPRERHKRLLATFASFLDPGGIMLLTMGAGAYEGVEPDFHGVRMYWSHFGSEENRRLVGHAGFWIEFDEIKTRGRERHQVIIARRM